MDKFTYQWLKTIKTPKLLIKLKISGEEWAKDDKIAQDSIDTILYILKKRKII